MGTGGSPSTNPAAGARGGAAIAVLAVVVAALVAWQNWPDPATSLLACVTVGLALMVMRKARASARSLPESPTAQAGASTNQGARRPQTPALDGLELPGSLLSVPAAGTAQQLPQASARGHARLRVLVAEDHHVNRQLLSSLLEALGHETQFAGDGEQALQMVRAQAFDVVLMDLSMPRLDGLAATQAIRALSENQHATVPIVALTADEAAATRNRCALAGMNDFLTKPISADALAACLRRLFGDAAAAQGRAVPGFARDAATLLDHGTLNELLGVVGRERLVLLAEAFFTDGARRLVHLREAVREARTGELQVDAHGLRGAALNLGLAAVADTAGALHDGATHLAAHEVAMLLQRLEQQLQQSHTALRSMDLAS